MKQAKQSQRLVPAIAPSRRTQQSRTDATRAALIQAACRQFGQFGYHESRTEDLVQAAGVTRGALYHHFADKAGLFEAVARQAANELTQGAARRARREPEGRWNRFVVSLKSYLAIIADNRETQQILLIDGPAVLGWLRWREIQAEAMLPQTADVMALLMDAGVIRRADPEPLAHLFLAAVYDAALTIAHANDSRKAGQQVTAALMHFVEGLVQPQDGAMPENSKMMV